MPPPRIRYGRSPWLDRARRGDRPAYPRLTGEIEAPVAIVGSGLTGAATAYAFAAAGIRCVVLEAGRIAEGASGVSGGLVLQHPEASFLGLEAAYGRRAARAIWQATRRAALDFGATIRRLKIRASFATTDAIVFAASGDDAKWLRREHAARRDAGIDGAWLTGRALAAVGAAAAGGIKTHGHAQVDPYRLCHALLEAAVTRGATAFEASAVTRVRSGRGGVEVATDRGLVRCETVVLATGEPTRGFAALQRHFEARETYFVLTPPLPAPVRAAGGSRDAILEDRHDPPHRLAWTPDGRILWSGGDQARTPERGREKVLVQRTGQLMYELSLLLPPISGIQPEYGWHAPYSRTHDGVPFIGPHRNYPRHLFALGQGANLAAAFLASRILLRHHLGQSERDDEYFGFARLSGR